MFHRIYCLYHTQKVASCVGVWNCTNGSQIALLLRHVQLLHFILLGNSATCHFLLIILCCFCCFLDVKLSLSCNCRKWRSQDGSKRTGAEVLYSLSYLSCMNNKLYIDIYYFSHRLSSIHIYNLVYEKRGPWSITWLNKLELNELLTITLLTICKPIVPMLITVNEHLFSFLFIKCLCMSLCRCIKEDQKWLNFSALRTVLEMKPRWSNLSDVPMLNKWLNFSHDWEHDLCIVDVELGEWRKSIKGVDFMLCSCCPAKANLFLLFKFSLFRECTLSSSANSVVYAISVSF